MNKLIVGAVLLASLIFVGKVQAQTRIYVGVAGADVFDNYSLGVTAGLEVPFLRHYEFDLQDIFSPLEKHTALGNGSANEVLARGFVWPSAHYGFNVAGSYSSYTVTRAIKAADYVQGGLAYRGIVGGLPARFTFDYLREVNNGISVNGTETSRLQGADIGFMVRYGCNSKFCFVTSMDFVGGRALTQGNPVCDGTYGLIGGPNGGPCYRAAASSGGFIATFAVEFLGHKDHEF